MRATTEAALAVLGSKDHEVLEIRMREQQTGVLPHLRDLLARAELVAPTVPRRRIGGLDVKWQAMAVVLDGMEPAVGIRESVGKVVDVGGRPETCGIKVRQRRAALRTLDRRPRRIWRPTVCPL